MAGEAGGSIAGEVVAGVIGIAGAVIGTVVGVLLERYLQGRGKVRIYVEDWNFWIRKTEAPPAKPVTTTTGHFRCRIEIYNDSDEAVGLRNVRIGFEKAGREVASARIEDADSGQGAYSMWALRIYERVAVLNLAPRQWGVVNAKGFFVSSEVHGPEAFDAVYVKADRPDGRTIRHLIPQGPRLAAVSQAQ